MKDTTNAYVGGHQFEVSFDFTPEIKESWGIDGGEPHQEEEIELTSISLGAIDVKALLWENAAELYDAIQSQVLDRIKEGEL